MPNKELREVALTGMFRAEYSRAKRFVYWGYGVDVVAAVLGIFTIGLVPIRYAPLASLGVAVLVVFGYLLKHQYDVIRSYAEAARRITVLVKGVNFKLTEKKYAELEKPFSRKAREEANMAMEKNQAYFATVADHGPVKLFEMLQESAFYTHMLMEKTAKYAGWMTIGFFTLLILALYLIAFVVPELGQNLNSNLVVGIMLIYLTSGALRIRGVYQDIGAKIRQIDDEMENRRELKRKPTLLEVFGLLNEYDCLMMEVPVIPDIVFDINQVELNSIWDKRKQEYLEEGWE